MRFSYIVLACLIVVVSEKAEPGAQFFNRAVIAQSALFKVKEIPQPAIGYKFHKIKNVHDNTFMNIQGGVINCLPMQYVGFNAQWQIIPVGASDVVKLRNRWNGYFADSERGYITIALSDQSPGTVWLLEPVSGNVFHIKNIQSRSYLSATGYSLRLTPGTANPGAMWQIQ
jgi:hypothetical protein